MSAFTFNHRVRYHEIDAQQCAFNSRYLEWADVAMAEYFRHLGWSYADMLAQGFDPALVHVDIDYEKPARLDELLQIAVSCTRVGTASFGLAFQVCRAGETLAEIKSVYVNLDAIAGVSRPVPEIVAGAMRADLRSPGREPAGN